MTAAEEIVDKITFKHIYCDILQHTATYCNILQHTESHCNTLQHTISNCNTLQNTATHCNTLQHTPAAADEIEDKSAEFFFASPMGPAASPPVTYLSQL